MERLLSRARMCGATSVFVMFLSDNVPMRRMAVRAGMSVQTADGESHAARELAPANAQELTRCLVEESLAHSRYFSTLGLAQWGSLLSSSAPMARERIGAVVPSA